jgi:hypothetical protein
MSLTPSVEGHEIVGSPAAVTTSEENEAQARFAANAENLRLRFGADLLVAVGAFPRYDPEDATQSAPKSLIALVGKGVSRVVDYTFLGDVRLNRTRAAKVALNLVRLHLLKAAEA